jgi:putative Mg2+ transporter-C (MgtC) family protein
MDMPVQSAWKQIVFRVVLTVLVAIVVGYNRSEHGKAAGMVTTLLVTLAAKPTA